MIKNLHLNLTHVFALVALSFLFVRIFWTGWAGGTGNLDYIFQFELFSLVVILYIGLNFAHHYFDKSLTTETALEYIMLAILVLVFMAGLLYK